MSEKASLLALVRKYQDKNDKTDLYFSLSTALNILQGKDEIEDVFVASFGGSRPKLPNGVIHKHFHMPLEDLEYRQVFKLDSLLVSVKNGSIVDPVGAKEGAKQHVIHTTINSTEALNNMPAMAIRAASLKAETGFEVDNDLVEAMKKVVPLMGGVSGAQIWNEFKRLMRSKTPSVGIELLRVTGILKEVLPEMDMCYGVEQNNDYHKYTVYEHCLLACDSCVKYDPRIRFAALIHDIGKPSTKGTNENGITFHRHEVESTKLARKIVKRFKIKRTDAAFIVTLVSNHMYHYDRKWKISTVAKFMRRVGLHKGYLGRMNKFPLFQIRHADRMGRGLNPITTKQLDFENRLEEVIRTGPLKKKD